MVLVQWGTLCCTKAEQQSVRNADSKETEFGEIGEGERVNVGSASGSEHSMF